MKAKIPIFKIIGALLVSLMLLGILSVSAFADGAVAIDETNFPDDNFRDYVKQFDKDNDGCLNEEEIADVKEIKVNKKISPRLMESSILLRLQNWIALTANSQIST